jgi:hypothetical protein
MDILKSIYNTVTGWFGFGPTADDSSNGDNGNPAPLNMTQLIGVIDLRPYCVAQYKMNDSAVNTIVVDSQGFSNGTAQRNCSILTSTGKISTSLLFNGTSDYINTNSTFQNFFSSDFTVSMWVRPTDGQPAIDNPLCGADNFPITNGFYFEIIPSGRIQMDYLCNSNDMGTITTGVLFHNGQETFHHVVVGVRQNGSSVSATCYFDNVNQNLTTPTNSCIMSTFTNIYNLFLGAIDDQGGADSFFKGLMDDVCFFNKALSADEIAFLYNNGNGTEDLLSPGTAIAIGGRSRRR